MPIREGPEFYKDADGQTRWRIWARNGSDILANSGEGYHNPEDAGLGLMRAAQELGVDGENLRKLTEWIDMQTRHLKRTNG